jgi:hypothetical protein
VSEPASDSWRERHFITTALGLQSSVFRKRIFTSSAKHRHRP